MKKDWLGRTLALAAVMAAVLLATSAVSAQPQHPAKGRRAPVAPAPTKALPRPAPAAAAVPDPAPVPAPVPAPPLAADRPLESSAVPLPADPVRDTGVVVPASRRRANQVGQEIVQLSVGMEGGMRHFSYADGLSRNLRNYQLTAAPLASAEGAIYPFMVLGTPVLRDVGVIAGYARAFALQSTASDAGTVDTQWSRYHVGGHLRVRTGSDASPVLGLTGAYADESFGFTGTQASSLPSVDYRFVRASGDVRVPIGRFALFAQAGYLFVLSAGDVAARFPKATVGGVEAELGGAFTLVPGLEARVTASYRRFFYSMNPTPGDGYVAGGALDELGSVLASVAYVY